MRKKINKIRILDSFSIVIITIDNFNIKKNRNDVKIDDKFFFISIIIAIANLKSKILEDDFLKSIYNFEQSFQILDILKKKLTKSYIYKVVNKSIFIISS